MTVKSGGTGNPGLTLTNCLGLGIECTYSTTSAVLNFDGGTPAALAAVAIPLYKISGLCAASATWTAKYEVVNHTSVFLVAEP
jgi:hypothetical protein